MEKRRKIEGRLDARVDYHIPDMERRAECDYLADKLDELLELASGVGGSVSRLKYDDDIFRQDRAFSYDEKDEYSNAVIEKVVGITYQYRRGVLTSEVYQVRIGSQVQRDDIDMQPIINVYEIRYYGNSRISMTTSIEQPNFVEEGEPDYTSREMTPYDHGEMLDEILWVKHLIDQTTHDEGTASE